MEALLCHRARLENHFEIGYFDDNGHNSPYKYDT
jgi:hypothetical protein